MNLPPGQNIVKTGWISESMQNAGDAVVRVRSLLVAKKFTFEELDFQEVYSLVSQYATVRLLIALLVKKKRKRRPLDVRNPFVDADLKEVIYVSQSGGFGQKGKRCTSYVIRQKNSV